MFISSNHCTPPITSIKGVTLIELTVVIAFILTFLSIVGIGAQVYIHHSDKAGCLVGLNNTNKSVRGYYNLTGDITWDYHKLQSAGLIQNPPNCPANDLPHVVLIPVAASVAGTVFSGCQTYHNGSTNNFIPPHQISLEVSQSW